MLPAKTFDEPNTSLRLCSPSVRLTDWIAHQSEGGVPLLVGRANSGLACTLRAICRPHSTIVFPAILCPSPVFTARACGFNAIFCDVREDNYTIDPIALGKLLDQRDDISAVLVAHLYGHDAAIEVITNMCRARGILAINDVAQALGSRNERGHSLARFGDVSLFSFGHTKLVDAGGGGALVVHRADWLEEIADMVDALPPAPRDLAKASASYREQYYAIRERAKEMPSSLAEYERLGQQHSQCYEYEFADDDLASSILNTSANLQDCIKRRRSNALLLRERLTSSKITHPSVDLDRIVPWRYTLRLQDCDREEVAQHLRDRGFDASPWYPNLQPWFYSGRQQSEGCEVANALGAELLNLWVDSKDSDEIHLLADCLLEAVEAVA